MDLTDMLMRLADAAGIPVYQDICTDEDADKYITIVYQDERPALCGNNKVLADQCDIYVSLYTPTDFDYFGAKKKIRDYLEKNEFVINSIGSALEDDPRGCKIRRTTFDCRFTEFRKGGNENGICRSFEPIHSIVGG